MFSSLQIQGRSIDPLSPNIMVLVQYMVEQLQPQMGHADLMWILEKAKAAESSPIPSINHVNSLPKYLPGFWTSGNIWLREIVDLVCLEWRYFSIHQLVIAGQMGMTVSLVALLAFSSNWLITRAPR